MNESISCSQTIFVRWNVIASKITVENSVFSGYSFILIIQFDQPIFRTYYLFSLFLIFSIRLWQFALASCRIHSTQSEDAWWCSLAAPRLTSCTRTHWTAGLRSARTKDHVPSSRALCPTFSVVPAVLSSWSSTTNSRNCCKCIETAHYNTTTNIYLPSKKAKIKKRTRTSKSLLAKRFPTQHATKFPSLPSPSAAKQIISNFS